MVMSAQNRAKKEQALHILGLDKGFLLNKDSKVILSRVWRKKTLTCHPDRHPEKQEEYTDLGNARDLLMDMIDEPQKYESFGSHMPSDQSDAWARWEDLFNQIFNQRNAMPKNSAPKKSNLPLFSLSLSFRVRNQYNSEHVLFGVSEPGFKDTCTLFFNIFNEISELTIKPENKNLHAHTADILLNEILKQNGLIHVTYPKDFFNAIQIKTLNTHLQKNKENNFYISIGTSYTETVSNYACFDRAFNSEHELRTFLAHELNGLSSYYVKKESLRIVNAKISAKGAQVVLEEILKSKFLKTVQVPPGFFNIKQQEQLNQHLKNNNVYIEMGASCSKEPAYCIRTVSVRDKPSLRKQVAHTLKIGQGFTIAKANLAPNGPQIILEALLESTTIKYVQVPKDFFNQKQQKQLDQHLTTNRKSKSYLNENKIPEIQKHKSTAMNKSYWSLGFGLSTAAYGLIYAYPIVPLAGLVFSGMFAGYLLSSIIASFYRPQGNSHHEKGTSKIDSHSAQAALKTRLDTKSWSGYFLSWGRPSTHAYPYVRPVAVHDVLVDRSHNKKPRSN